MMNKEMERLFSNVKIEEPKTEIREENETEGVLTIEPLLQGYGTTLGNSLRRVMLSSLPGSKAVRIAITVNGERVMHEFSSVPSVKEDVTEIVLNVKGIIAKLYSEGPKTFYIDSKGNQIIRAGDIRGNGELTVINPNHVIATLTQRCDFNMEITFASGVGYVSSDKNKEIFADSRLGYIYVDSVYTPVNSVSYSVENTRVGGNMNYDKLTLNVKTNGGISPTEAVIVASQILKEHYGMLADIGGDSEEANLLVPSEEKTRQEILDMPIIELELSRRSYNCLMRSQIKTVGQLANYTLSDMMKVRNLGRKSLEEIQHRLQSMSLSFKEEE